MNYFFLSSLIFTNDDGHRVCLIKNFDFTIDVVDENQLWWWWSWLFNIGINDSLMVVMIQIHGRSIDENVKRKLSFLIRKRKRNDPEQKKNTKKICDKVLLANKNNFHLQMENIFIVIIRDDPVFFYSIVSIMSFSSTKKWDSIV